ncbi:MAG: galactose mutarotase [Lachnospiraceae bacterium]|nr:galactose mutarotase [Lachnospiraceae bacterium]MDD6503930.1 galactose mutarotase [Lachnospiraceae bacterium]
MGDKSFGRVGLFGKSATLFSIKNSKGMEVLVTDYGATTVSIFVRDRQGELRDVILGYDNAKDYAEHWSYFGATVGRNANRIAGAQISIDGEVYHLEKNDRGNNLHSGSKSLTKVFWDVKSREDNCITFVYNSPDLEEGYPGNATVEVTFEVTEDNDYLIRYHALSDKKTVFNMTNHCYYNLNGAGNGTVLEHVLQINASHYTPCIDQKSIPTGEIAPVEGTPFDFTVAKPIGQDIHADHPQIALANGYDHNFAIDKTMDGVEKAAVIYSQESGIQMEVFTDTPGIQLYTANGVKGEVGKGNTAYENYGAFCLETQYFPNAINEPNFSTPVTDANVPYESTTRYHFSLI